MGRYDYVINEECLSVCLSKLHNRVYDEAIAKTIREQDQKEIIERAKQEALAALNL